MVFEGSKWEVHASVLLSLSNELIANLLTSWDIVLDRQGVEGTNRARVPRSNCGSGYHQKFSHRSFSYAAPCDNIDLAIGSADKVSTPFKDPSKRILPRA